MPIYASEFVQTLLVAITIGSLYALIALGYTMVYGILKLINFAHSDVVVLGGWITFTFATYALPRIGYDLSAVPWYGSLLVIVFVMLTCGTIGFVIERLAYRPIRKAPRLNALITAIGVSLLLQNAGQLQGTVSDGLSHLTTGKIIGRGTANQSIKLDQEINLSPTTVYKLLITGPNIKEDIKRDIAAQPGKYQAGSDVVLKDSISKSQLMDAKFTLTSVLPPLMLPFGTMPQAVPKLMSDAPFFTIRFGAGSQPVQVTLLDIYIVGTALVLMLVLELLVFHTKLGMAMRAVSFNTDYAALMGIPIDRVIGFTFFIGAALAGAAGFLYAMKYTQIQQPAHYVWVLLGLKAFVSAVVGGIGNLRGAVVGGFLIAFIEQFGSVYGTKVFDNASAYIDVCVFGMLIIVLLVKPSGIFGSTTREKV